MAAFRIPFGRDGSPRRHQTDLSHFAVSPIGLDLNILVRPENQGIPLYVKGLLENRPRVAFHDVDGQAKLLVNDMGASLACPYGVLRKAE
jgi:hypothetical protein